MCKQGWYGIRSGSLERFRHSMQRGRFYIPSAKGTDRNFTLKRMKATGNSQGQALAISYLALLNRIYEAAEGIFVKFSLKKEIFGEFFIKSVSWKRIDFSKPEGIIRGISKEILPGKITARQYLLFYSILQTQRNEEELL